MDCGMAGVRRHKSASEVLGGAGPPYRPCEALQWVMRKGVAGTKVLGLWRSHNLRPAVYWAGRGRPCLGLGIPRLRDAGGVNLVVASVQACRPIASGSDCMRIHASTLGALLREVGCSLNGLDQVFVPGKKSSGSCSGLPFG